MISVDVLTTIDIACPVDIVSNYASNPDNAPQWYVNIKSVEWKTEPPLVTGSEVAFVAHFMRRRLEYTYRIIQFLPGESLIMRTAEGPFPMETSYRWQAIDDKSTHMELRNRGEPSGFSGIFAPLMSMMMRRANNKDLQLLKNLCEERMASL